MMNGKDNVGSVFALEGWLKFNQYKWGVTPLRLRLTEGDRETLPAIETVLYLDKKGRIVQPPLNPYLPVIFYPTPTDKKPRVYRQWLNLSKLLVEEFIKRGVKGAIAFPPEVIDIRQWQWHGFLGEVRYTFYIDLPLNLDMVDSSARKEANKAKKQGFICDVADKNAFSEVIACLEETGKRKKFSYMLTTKDLEVALDLLGEDVLRVYVCRNTSGEIVSARVVLITPNLRAWGWVSGTKKHFLASGCAKFLIWYTLTDLSRLGIEKFDFCGANLPTVSAAKADWGGTLIPYYVIRPLNLRAVAGWLLKKLSQFRKRK